MKAVFVGGSRKLSKLNESVKHRLASIMERGLWVYVGDANGADKALQRFFASKGYERVVVYHVGNRYRNNVGRWQTKVVDAPSDATGFDYYAAKDLAMAADAAFGLMLWDGSSRGTLSNVRNLLAHGKPVAVYVSPERRFRDLKREADLSDLVSSEFTVERSGSVPTGTRQRELGLGSARGRRGRTA